MRKSLFFFSLMLVTVSMCLNAQMYFKENLSRYSAGDNLEKVVQSNSWTTNVGDWTVSGKNDGANASSISPVIAAENMSYLNYATSNKVIVCDPSVMATTTSYRQIVMRFIKDAVPVTTPDNQVYYAAMIKLSGSNDGDSGPLMGFMKQGSWDTDPGYTLPSASYSTTWRARVWAKVTGEEVQFAIHKSGSPTVWSTNKYNLNETHLLVVKYTNNSAASAGTADEFHLLINPVASQSEPEITAYMAAEGNSSGGGADLRMIALVSQKLKMKVGQIRVASSFNSVIAADGTYTTTSISTNNIDKYFEVVGSTKSLQVKALDRGKVTVFDLGGRMVSGNHVVKGDVLNMNLISGYYLIKFSSTNGQVLTKRVCIH